MQALLVIGVAVPTPGGVGSFHEAYRIAVTTFFRRAERRGGERRARAACGVVLPGLVPGVVFMAQDGLSVAGLVAAAWPARRGAAATRCQATAGELDEVPILRPSGR